MSYPQTFAPPALGQSFTSMVLSGLFYESATDSIVAYPGGAQGGATQLTAETNRIGTVATAGDSVKLPASAGGLQIVVTNAASVSLNVYPSSGDAINGAAVNLPQAIAAGKTSSFSCAVSGQWHAVISA